jgi:TolB-like protein/tetratricopeptide (TPR) repeat protein
VQRSGTTGRDPVASLPSADDVRADLERVLSSQRFQASERRRAFLRYIVEETLAGRPDRLKGYTIAVAVFGRDETFDPQADPVVRLEARRLRRDLDSYYVDAGTHDAVRISVPKGSYVPRFEWHEETRPPPLSHGEQTTDFSRDAADDVTGPSNVIVKSSRAPARFPLIVAVVAAVAAIAVAGWFLTAGKERVVAGGEERVPSVVVLPFEALSASEDSRYLASGISQELVSDLMRFPGFRLYSLSGSFEADAGTEPANLGRDLGVAYVVSGSVNASGKEARVTAQTVDAGTGRVVWSRTYHRPLTPEPLMRVQRDLAGEIATVLGQPYGVVNNDLDSRLTTPAVSHMRSYVCVLRAYSYRRNFSRNELDPVLACLQEAVRRDPDYTDAWAMLGWLHVDAGRNGYVGHNTQDEYKKALQAASEAVRLAPNSILALKVLASVYHYLGRYDDSERTVRKALNVNPYDPETLAQLGWRLAVRGKFAEGIPLLKRAIARTVNPPGWYFSLVAIDLYLKRDYERMLQVAERSAGDGRGVSQALIAIAAGELGKRDAARRALKKMAGYNSFAGDPAAYLRRHGATDEIVNALMAGLRKVQRLASN